MNSLLFLRKSASPSSTRLALASLKGALFQRNHPYSSITANHYSLTSNITAQPPPLPKVGLDCFSCGYRSFHVGGSLGFRVSVASQAEYAVADFSDEDRSAPPKGGDEGLDIAKLGISKEIVTALARKGITKLFPIQRAVLEPAMQGRDMIGRARTGTGKTLAFGIPIMDKIIRYNTKNGQGVNPQALVMAPTRELARQVEKEFKESAPVLYTLCVYGGVPIQSQINELRRGVDVVVGTPGRIIDLLKRGSLNLSEVQFIVLDEADQMLNVGFADDVETILENLPRQRQSMMFSATMPSWIVKLTQKYLNNPLTVDLVGNSDQKLADGISLYSIVSDVNQKGSIIGTLVTEHAKGGKTIVFTQTKRDADRLSYGLKRSFACEALHGDISQNQRERTLAAFRDGTINLLVATDVAARGLDVPNVDLVIHYELPNSSEIFVHRSGRTGRAGKKGSAILIYSSHQQRDVKSIERDVGCRFLELPSIAVEGGGLYSDMGGSGPSRGFGGRYGDTGSGFGRSGGYGASGGYRGGSRYGGGYEGGYGSGSSYGRSGGFGSGGRSGGFGSGGRSGVSSGFGSPRSGGSSGGFGDFGSQTRSSEYGSGGRSSSGSFGSSGRSDRFGGFGDN